jgi:ketosteroid isomerase-like protein
MRDDYRRLIDTFARGWEKGDPEELLSVFSQDAVFLETPFGRPDRGLEALRAYWIDLPKHQAEVTFKTGEIFEAGPWFATEFQLRFRRRRTGDWVEAKGAIFCETKQDKINEMRMYWHRRNE